MCDVEAPGRSACLGRETTGQLQMRQILDDGEYRHDDERPPLPALSIVMTRFNMVVPGFRGLAQITSEAAFDDWISARMPIFESVCFSSLRAQVKPPDAWLLGFDSVSPERVERVTEMIKPFPWMRPVWQRVNTRGEHEGARSSFLREIKALLTPAHRYVISTRVDNDDALGRGYCDARDRFCASVVERRPELEEFWITFPLGAQLSPTALRLYPQNGNPFLSHCARVEDGRWTRRTALDARHNRVFEEEGAVFKAVTRAPMWLQYVHRTNVLNSEKPALSELRDADAELRRFGLDPREIERTGLFERSEDPSGAPPTSLAPPPPP